MQYIASIIIAALLFAVVALIIRSMYKAKKAGKSPTCGCNCSSCAMNCHKKEN